MNYFGEVNIFRHYALFSLMAGIRGTHKLYQPKGLPERLSWTTRDKAALYITDNPQIKDVLSCTREDAERWGSRYTDESKTRIWNPDFHTHSWLDLGELDLLLKEYNKIGGRCNALEATYSAMITLKNLGCNPRLIFWFDS